MAIVGHFPFLPRVREKAKALWVIEKNPREGDFNETEADRFIPQADVVAITGTSLTNHTLPHLLELCNPRPLSSCWAIRSLFPLCSSITACMLFQEQESLTRTWPCDA